MVNFEYIVTDKMQVYILVTTRVFYLNFSLNMKKTIIIFVILRKVKLQKIFVKFIEKVM